MIDFKAILINIKKESRLSKTKNKTHNEVQHLKGYIRELEKDNKRLRSQIKQFEKYERSQDDEVVSDSEDTFLPEVPKLLQKDCDSCGKGVIIETIEIIGKVYGTCNVCGTNERLK